MYIHLQVFGLTGHHITIEVDANKSLPTLEIIGLPDAAIKEAKERIRMTFKNAGIQLPPRKIVLNLAPSDIRKIGTRFDFPMAVAILLLIQEGSCNEDIIAASLFFGELGLDGSVKKVQGLLPAIISAYKQGWRSFFIPVDNIDELSYIPDITLYPVEIFPQFVDMIYNDKPIEPIQGKKEHMQQFLSTATHTVDFQDIKGHMGLKRALTIAAAGMHNVLLVGPPGSGKTMLAKALQSILPPLTFTQIIELSQIYSLAGGLHKEKPLVVHRPFRVVHHTASKVAIVGGGKYMTPGEISLAHLGILFFDEIAEFPREVLEVLRQPLEDKVITISRAHGSVQYPSDVMFVAAMNPCKCGYYKDKQKQCTCSLRDIARYQHRISGPLLDRFDMILEVPRESVDTILDKEHSYSSQDIIGTITHARNAQTTRYAEQEPGYTTNSQLDAKAISKYISLDTETQAFFTKAIKQLHISPRVMHRTMKLARTIADIEGVDSIAVSHIAEALQYRAKTMFVET